MERNRESREPAGTFLEWRTPQQCLPDRKRGSPVRRKTRRHANVRLFLSGCSHGQDREHRTAARSSLSSVPGFWSSTGQPGTVSWRRTSRPGSSIGLHRKRAATTLPARPRLSDSTRLAGVLGLVSEPPARDPETCRSGFRVPQAGSASPVPSVQEDRRRLVGAGREPPPRPRGRGRRGASPVLDREPRGIRQTDRLSPQLARRKRA